MKNKTIWSNRFKGKPSKSFQRIGSSINVDKRLYKQDIAASIAHVQMLIKQKIIHNIDGKKIINGLNKIKSQIDRGKFTFQEKAEINLKNSGKTIFQAITKKNAVYTITGKYFIKGHNASANIFRSADRSLIGRP